MTERKGISSKTWIHSKYCEAGCRSGYTELCPFSYYILSYPCSHVSSVCNPTAIRHHVWLLHWNKGQGRIMKPLGPLEMSDVKVTENFDIKVWQQVRFLSYICCRMRPLNGSGVQARCHCAQRSDGLGRCSWYQSMDWLVQIILGRRHTAGLLLNSAVNIKK